MSNIRLSAHFTLAEFEKTDHAAYQAKNKVSNALVLESLKALVTNVLEPLRVEWNKPLSVNSGYRCQELNCAVGSSPSSQHRKGEAADICPFGRNGKGENKTIVELAKMAKSMCLPFDQMILYPSFVHFSHRLNGKQRGQILYSKNYKGERL